MGALIFICNLKHLAALADTKLAEGEKGRCASAVKVDLFNLTKKYALNAVCMCERDLSLG
jgi:hypothetical protein